MMSKVSKYIYKLIHIETGAITWFNDSSELYYVIEWYDGQDYEVYKYKLVEDDAK